MAVTSIARPAHSALDATLATLDSVTQRVDAFERGIEDVPPWGPCRDALGEARGALIMLEMDGARLLVDECMALMEALDGDAALSDRHAMDALLYALLLLPRYIEHSRSARDEAPETLLPTINGLRGLRRAVPVPEYEFADLTDVSRDLAPLAGELPAADAPDPARLRRMRHMFLTGLLGLFASPEALVHRKQVHRALARLAPACGDTLTGRWLLLAARLAGCAIDLQSPAGASVRLLLSRLDFYIRETLLGDPPVLNQRPPPMVRQALLYYTGRLADRDPLLGRVSRELELAARMTPAERIRQERDAVAAPDAQVLEAVSRALGEEMEQVQSFIETLSRLSSVTRTERDELAEHLNRLGHTLTLLGLSGQAAAVKREHTRLQSLGDDVDGERLRELLSQCVDTLSESEDAVSRLSRPEAAASATERGPRLEEASRQAISEALTNLARVRHSLEYFNGDRDDGDDLESTQAPLNEIRGSLAILGLDRAAEQLARAGRAITALDEHDAGNGERLNAVADALAAIEWYMESLLEGIEGGDDTLEIAEEALAKG
ncbi:hypothetical protein QWY84_15285 [Aquisalimonas lutea]|uniref:hypothetical protein n=1 Tax=Aquisalimonas lutea TaxID=1327750 RepID=UPI0025B2969F|nr:hypothetical protein [Aquisalimonas lutea]MDN3518982.1 hypothetical protein [Aquisalimonas lutea]